MSLEKIKEYKNRISEINDKAIAHKTKLELYEKQLTELMEDLKKFNVNNLDLAIVLLHKIETAQNVMTTRIEKGLNDAETEIDEYI